MPLRTQPLHSLDYDLTTFDPCAPTLRRMAARRDAKPPLTPRRANHFARLFAAEHPTPFLQPAHSPEPLQDKARRSPLSPGALGLTSQELRPGLPRGTAIDDGGAVGSGQSPPSVASEAMGALRAAFGFLVYAGTTAALIACIYAFGPILTGGGQ